MSIGRTERREAAEIKVNDIVDLGFDLGTYRISEKTVSPHGVYTFRAIPAGGTNGDAITIVRNADDRMDVQVR